MDARRGLATLVTAVVLLAVGATVAGAQGKEVRELSETLAELSALGLQVEVRSAQAPGGVSSTTVGGLSSAGAPPEAGTRQRENWWARARVAIGDFFSSSANQMRDEALDGIRAACRINEAAGAGTPLELSSVTISVGIVSVTFTPSSAFCEDVVAEQNETRGDRDQNGTE